MTVNEILRIMNNRVLTLNQAKTEASLSGDLDRLNQIENELLSTQMTIDKLQKTING